MEVRSVGPVPAKILIVGEAPGAEEARMGEPFVGTSGKELTKMLAEAGIVRKECRITNVVGIRPPKNEIEYFIPDKKKNITPAHVPFRGRRVLPCVIEGVQKLESEIRGVNPNLILAVGKTAMWATTGLWEPITEWRGSVIPCDLVPGFKVLATIHPAAIVRQWSWRPILVQDLRRARKEASTRALETPQWDFQLRPGLDLVRETLASLWTRAEERGAPLVLSVDIETALHHITCIGLAWSKLEALCIPFTSKENSEGYWTLDEEAFIVWHLYKLLTHPNVICIGQNFVYDCQHILKWWHFIPRNVRDTRIAQHTMFPGLPRTLKPQSLLFMSSVYCDLHMNWKNKEIYEAMEKEES